MPAGGLQEVPTTIEAYGGGAAGHGDCGTGRT